jgi:hypothetical protein
VQVYPVVSMDYDRREEGYLALGNYLDGENAEGTKYEATQPVIMCYEPNVRRSRPPAPSPPPLLARGL